MSHRTVTVSVVGLTGKESVKGAQGVGKSIICNRFVRGDHDDFLTEHSSVLSQTDFGGSPVINNDHWLYWGERTVDSDDGGTRVSIRVIEQTEFLDDETFEPLAGPSTSEGYSKRASRIRLESRDKLMYIQKEQLGLEAEFPQHVLTDGKCQVDCFVYVYDTSRVEGRSFDSQVSGAYSILVNLLKAKKPVILVLSKCDILVEESRKALQVLLNKKDLKGVNFPTIEVSAFMDVNIDEVFITAALSATKGKTRLKILSFGDAAKIVCERNKTLRQAYIRLLQGVLPIDTWPIQRLSWSSLMLKLDIDRHPDYCGFIRVYGTSAARKLYDQHVNEAREHWMAARLRALVPSLPKVFAVLMDRSEVQETTWNDAKKIILEHALFDEYFQPLGVLGKQLDPLSPDVLYEEKRGDLRIPAEILLRHESRVAYENYQHTVEAENRQERLEEDFEFLLSETSQVTPGKPLQDVCLFLQGFGAYESLAPSQATLIYDRFQNDLVHRAEVEFSECLLEYVELIVDNIRSSGREFYQDHRNVLTDRAMLRIKEHLQEDVRYRQLSRLFELRDNMIHQFASFITSPNIPNCPAKARCSDIVTSEALHQFFQRRQLSHQSESHHVEVTVHGEIGLVAQFITDMNCLLRNDPFISACGPALIKCFGEVENDEELIRQPRTQLFLLDSPSALEEARSAANSRGSQSLHCYLPAVYVLVCDPGHYDLLPYLHQQGAILGDTTGGIFIGAGSADSEDSHWSRSDCSSIFGRDQLLRICDTVCSSQLDRRRCDMRVQASLLCGDPFPVESLLATMFPYHSDNITTVVNANLLTAGIVPVNAVLPSNGRFNRVDVHFGSYHNWLVGRTSTPVHGHVVVYYARRPASLAHARAAISKVLDEGFRTVSGKAILLVAVADVQDYFNDEETNLLLTEGNELATSIGAEFITVSPDSASGNSESIAFLEFYDRLQGIVPQYNPESMDRSTSKRESDGYATLSDFKHLHVPKEEQQRTYSAYKTSYSAGTLLSDSSTSRESTLSIGRMLSPRADSVVSAPTMRPSASTSAMSASYSAASRPRRRAAPLVAPLRLPPLRQAETAPLATPETIEIAPEYSIVQDALTDDDHIYATLDFVSPSASKEEERSISGSDRSDGKKDKKRPLRARMFSSNSHSTEPMSSPSVITAPNSQPSSAVPSYVTPEKRLLPARTAPLLAVPVTETSRPTALFGPSLMRSSRTQPLQRSPAKQISSKMMSLRPQTMPNRSVTMDIISQELVVKARAAPIAERANLRHSLSAESLATLMKDKKKKMKDFGGRNFVRKVATSFRFKKNEKDDKDDVETSSSGSNRTLLISPPLQGSRSLPQSPHMDRKTAKKYGTAVASSTEKVSSAFSWLPSRSPKRTTKGVVPEANQGVVSPTDTLDTLSTGSRGVPVFLTKCVDFIEREGGLELEGLYRVPGNQAQLIELEKAYRDKGDVDLVRLNMPVHVVATAVKNFFSCLPDPLIPYELHVDVIACLSRDESEVATSLANVVRRMPDSNGRVLKYFTEHLERVASSPPTAMDSVNLSKVWFPTFFRPKFENFVEMSTGMTKFQQAMEALLRHSHVIFS